MFRLNKKAVVDNFVFIIFLIMLAATIGGVLWGVFDSIKDSSIDQIKIPQNTDINVKLIDEIKEIVSVEITIPEDQLERRHIKYLGFRCGKFNDLLNTSSLNYNVTNSSQINDSIMWANNIEGNYVYYGLLDTKLNLTDCLPIEFQLDDEERYFALYIDNLFIAKTKIQD